MGTLVEQRVRADEDVASSCGMLSLGSYSAVGSGRFMALVGRADALSVHMG